MKRGAQGAGFVRIIGGKWRGRTLKVENHTTLRPTPDRVRETLFNWLMHDISGARCLDLFAGTGALGFEALSRGAKEVVFIESYSPIVKALESTALVLEAQSGCEIILSDSIAWLKSIQQKNSSGIAAFDIIFLDPPYLSDLLPQAISLLATSNLIHAQTRIYIEARKPLSEAEIPASWHCLKQKVAGEVAYHLIQGHKA